MLMAVVIGPVWASKKISELPSGAFLEVEVVGSGARHVAVDQLGCGTGDTVLITSGSVASGYLPGSPPIDAVVVGVVDETTDRSIPHPERGKQESTRQTNKGVIK